MFLETVNALAPTSPTVPTGLGLALALGYIQHMLKRLESLPKINFYSTKINFALRVVLSGLGTLGLSWAWSSAPDGGHHLSLYIPSFAVLLLGAWHWFVQFAVQHGFEGILQSTQQTADVSKESGVPAKE